MDVKTGIKSQGSISRLGALSASGDDPLRVNGLLAVAAGRAEELCDTWMPSHPADVTTRHTGNCCLHTEDPGSGQSVAGVQVCKKTGLDRSLSVNSLLSEQADAPAGNPPYFVKGDSASSATVYAEKVPCVSDDFSDDDLEYFECSDVLTAREDEAWRKKLQFLLESDDEDDLKLREDCDGCAYFLGEMPCAPRVSGNTTPVDTPIGFCGHHSKFKGLNVRGDPSMYSQSPLQADMTLAVGHHREKSSGLGDKSDAPVASAAAANERPGSQDDASGRLAAGPSADKARRADPAPAEADPSAGGTGAAGTHRAAGTMTGAGAARVAPGESPLLLEEGGGDAPEDNAPHAVRAFAATLRRNLFKLLNPLELCRYVGAIGQSLQAAAEGREASAPSPGQEGVLSTQTESLQVQAGPCQAEEADKDCHWARKRTRGLSEQSQMPAENVSLGDQGANLKSVAQNCENLRTEPETGGTFRACESGGTSQPAAGALSAENTPQAKNADLQTSSLRCAPWGRREGCPQEAFSGQEIISSGHESKGEISAFPLRGADSVPDKQESLCAVLSSAKLCDGPAEGEQRAGLEAHPRPVLESGREGDADISAVHDKLWKLLHEDDSDRQIPFAARGVTSLETRPAGIRVAEPDVGQETCCRPPLPMEAVEEQELPPACVPSPGEADCGGRLLQRAAACQGAKPTARVVGAGGACGGGGAGNEMGAPAVCPSADSTLLRPGQCSKPGPAVVDSSGCAVAWEGQPPVNKASQTGEADSPQRLRNAESGNLARPEANPAGVSDVLHGTAGQLLHPECRISRIKESVPGEGCHFRDCYPARGGLASFPEEKGISPRENTCPLTHAEHSSVNATRGGCEVNLQAEGNLSDSNAQHDTNSQSCHLSEINGCQDLQVVSAAQEYCSVTQLPTLIKPPEAVTPENLPQNAEQLPEIAKQEGAFTPSSGDPLLSHFCLEVPSCEPAKPGDQSEICTTDERRAETRRDSGVSESHAAVSPHHTAEQRVVLVEEEEFEMDSATHPTRASPSVRPHGTAERAQGAGDRSDPQRLPGTETLLLLPPAVPSSSAVARPGTGSQVKTGSAPAGGNGNRNLSVPETSCRASPGLFRRAPGETGGEGDEQERPRGVEWSPEEAEAKAPLISSRAQRQIVNTSAEQSCPDGIPSSEVTEPDYSIRSTEHDKGEEVRAAESVVGGLVCLPPVDSGSSRCFQEQSPCSRTQPFPSASATRDPFPLSAERERNPEGSKSCQAEPEPTRCKQDTAKCGHLTAGAKKKLPSAALSKKPRLEEKGSVSCLKKAGKSEAGVTRKEDRKPEQRKLVLKKDSKAPRLLKKIQAESFPECSGNVKLCCQFGDIHGDSTVTWTKDSEVLARLQRSPQDDSPVSLEIAKASDKDQGMYYCCLNNIYGKVTAEFHLTAAVLERLSSFQSYEGVEEIEFMQLLFRGDSISDSYFGGNLRGVLATEELHFGEGMHRRAFRSRVRQGLAPVFAPGRACVLKVHSALAPGTGTREELVRKNYNLALQECCVQNAAREYAKLYAAEAETLEGFGEVPEIIPIFLIHRPANSIPYATVEEELVGEFVKYSVRDGKEVNFLRRDSEAGQKCCTFQHWVYEKTSGNLLVTDLQGVGMKLTDVGIATLAKGYKGFKGNCSFSFIEQFRALHQCNEYCEMLGLKALRTAHQKQRRAAASKGKNLPSSSAGKKTGPKKGREHRDFISSEH